MAKKKFNDETRALIAAACALFAAPDAMASKQRSRGDDIFLMGRDDYSAFQNSRSIADVARITAVNEKARILGHQTARAFNDLASGDNLIAQLNTFAVSFPGNDSLADEANLLAPEVETGGIRFDFTDYSGGLTGLEYDAIDERAVNGDFKTLKDKGAEITAKLPNRGLATDIDTTQYPDLGREAMRRQALIMERLSLNRLRRSVAGLVAVGANNAVTWNGTAGQDPDADMLNHITTGKTATGVRANVGYISEVSWAKRFTTLRAQDSIAASTSASDTAEKVALTLMLRKFMVSTAVQKDGADAITAVLAGKALFFRNFENASLTDSSVMKTFWTPVEGGGRYKVLPLRQVGDKVWRLCVETYEKQIITGPATNTVRMLTIS